LGQKLACLGLIEIFIFILFFKGSVLYTQWTWDVLLFLIISISGSLLRWWSFRTLGKFFTYDVGIRKEHKLITYGPYRLLIHPSYTGIFASYSGLYYLLGYPWINGWPFFIGMIAWAFTFYFRVANEENSLQEHFGSEAWKKYISVRWRFIPFIY